MIVKCQRCGSDLRFDPVSRMLRCGHCDQLFDPETMENDTLEMNLYHCRACGGELMINNLEAASFCPYCGQATIVFDRVSKELRPDYVVPFEITGEQAVGLIRYRLSRSVFVPRAVKNFSVEQIRGIYMPYWLWEIYYKDRLTFRGEVKEGDRKRTYYFLRGADVTLTHFTMDASARLRDEYAQRLEPFHMNKLAPFYPEYLSGFYADRYDVDAKEVEADALMRVREIFEDEVGKTVHADHVSVVSRNPESKILKVEYAMLPVWFMTFRYRKKPYTLLVNGQTGKVVGGVPYQKSLVAGLLVLLTVVFWALVTGVLYPFVKYDLEGSMRLIYLFVFMGAAALMKGLRLFARVSRSIALAGAEENVHIVRNRQEGSV